MRFQVLLIVQLVLAAMLVWTCFCRAVKTCADTHREVRWAILLEGLAGGLVFGAPLMPVVMQPSERYWSPTWAEWSTPWEVWLVLLFAVTLVQVVTAKYWAAGQAPVQFQRSPAERSGGVVFAGMLLMVGLVSLAPAARAQDQREAITVPIATIEQGQVVRCAAPEGCVIFTRMALALELARFADAACGPAPAPAKPEPQGPRT